MLQARVCREQLAQAYRELSEVVRQLKVLYAAIERAEDTDGDQPNGQAGECSVDYLVFKHC